ncbi:DsbA family protein [Caulobacter sp. 17J80-11]|uniref:DsbA family protein n=1 Tax=Caulobacter sp. 17J80-11 TaxID=2763502 RepID=UPI0016534F8C|nr:DsbA family protein [Caulobacter sp. 17J80-11]MBC6982854.1 thioredoxin domain-containing protein [Caulobacter sp. 17J80-11]
MSTLRVPVTSLDHVQGPEDAPVTLVEYGDYQCPYCGLAYPVVKAILAQLQGRIRFAFRHFPLTEAHPLAETAAEVAEFAGEHGKFWPMHDLIYENQHRLSLPGLFALAGALGLPQVEMRDALGAHRYAGKVQADFMSGVRSGVNGTPSFFINGVRHDGGYGYPELMAGIEQAMMAEA